MCDGPTEPTGAFTGEEVGIGAGVVVAGVFEMGTPTMADEVVLTALEVDDGLLLTGAPTGGVKTEEVILEDEDARIGVGDTTGVGGTTGVGDTTGLGVEVVEDEVLTGLAAGTVVDLVFGSLIRGGVHSGGALGGRNALGVCENRGGVHAGVAYGFRKTVTVTVTVSRAATC